MTDVTTFVASYSEADRPRIDFAWNGKHAAEFSDTNQQFRRDVVSYCIEEPGKASAELLGHLFTAEALWAREAWGSPQHFGTLAAALLQRGGEGSLDTFARGLSASFDTLGACHRTMRISPDLAARLAVAARESAAIPGDADLKGRLQTASQLFERIQKGTASQGWVSVPPGTPVQNIRVAWPRWYHKVWTKLSAWINKRAT
jgi:hypothetical protein